MDRSTCNGNIEKVLQCMCCFTIVVVLFSKENEKGKKMEEKILLKRENAQISANTHQTHTIAQLYNMRCWLKTSKISIRSNWNVQNRTHDKNQHVELNGSTFWYYIGQTTIFSHRLTIRTKIHNDLGISRRSGTQKI